MNWTLTADWHLTADPDDEYRWGLFPWLREKIRGVTYDPAFGQYGSGGVLFVLGDISQNKDYHPSRFVNRVCDELIMTYRSTGLTYIVILGANHDGLGEEIFFRFLRHHPFIHYITKPEVKVYDGKRIALLPHTRTPERDWKDLPLRRGDVEYVMAHATVSGAQTESGYVLRDDPRADAPSGNGASLLTRLRLGLEIVGESRVFSGDIHVPQRIGTLEYVGAPYPVRHGDDYKGRVINLSNRGHREEWHYPSIRKAKITASNLDELSLRGIRLRRGDQLKVELALPKSERHSWHQLKEGVQKWCDARGVKLKGCELTAPRTLRIGSQSSTGSSQPTIRISSDEALAQYLKKSKVDDSTASVGRQLLRKAKG